MRWMDNRLFPIYNLLRWLFGLVGRLAGWLRLLVVYIRLNFKDPANTITGKEEEWVGGGWRRRRGRRMEEEGKEAGEREIGRGDGEGVKIIINTPEENGF